MIELRQNAVFPGWWMNEGGQSSTGQVRLIIVYQRLFLSLQFQLIDFVIATHPARDILEKVASDRGISQFDGEAANPITPFEED